MGRVMGAAGTGPGPRPDRRRRAFRQAASGGDRPGQRPRFARPLSTASLGRGPAADEVTGRATIDPLMTSLSIVIPTWNRADLLRLCLRAVVNHAPAGTEIIVVAD